MLPKPASPNHRRFFRARVARWGVLTLVFVVLATWTIWPCPRHAYTLLPTGRWAPGTVPMLNAWTIWWNADRLSHGLAGYWNAPIFHPETGTFAFSEPQPATWAVAPIVWVTGSPIPAYHAYLIATLVLNAAFAVRFLRTLQVRWAVCVAGGIATLLLPLVHQNGDAMQLMSIWGILWTFDAVVKLHRNPSWRRGIVLGIAFSAVFAACIHHGVFLALLLGLSVWIAIPTKRWKQWLVGVACAGATAVLILSPLLLPMRQILAEHEFGRPAAKVQALSAEPSAWLQTVPGGLTDFVFVGGRCPRPLSPGWIRTGLALGGILLAIRRRRDRRAVLFLAAIGAWALLWSFGLNLRVGPWQPWSTLADWVPGFTQVRSAYRFAYFVQLAVVVLAALGLDRLLRGWTNLASTRRARWVHTGVLAVACLLLACEVPPTAVRRVAVPDVSVEPDWGAFLRKNTAEGRSVVCLPFAQGFSAKDSQCTGRWMLHGTRHGVPMVNGYSGFFPKPWFRLVEALKEEPYSEPTLDLLTAAGVEYIVIDPALMEKHKTPPTASGRYQLVRVFRDESGVEVWRVEL
jgi:hypothetical protein